MCREADKSSWGLGGISFKKSLQSEVWGRKPPASRAKRGKDNAATHAEGVGSGEKQNRMAEYDGRGVSDAAPAPPAVGVISAVRR